MRPLEPHLLRVSRAARRDLAVVVAAGLGAAGAVVAEASLLAHVIAAAFEHAAGFAEVRGAMAALAGVLVARALFDWLTQVAGQRAATTVISDLRARLLAHVAAIGPVGVASERAGEVALTAGRGLDALEPWFSRYLPQLALAALVPPLVLARVAGADALSAGIIAVTLPLIPVFMALVGWASERHTARQWAVLGALAGHFLDAVRGIPVLRVFGRALAQVETIAAVAERHRSVTMATLRVAFLSALALEILATLGTALVAVAIGLRLVDGRLGLEAGLTALILAPEAYLPLRRVGAHFHASVEGVAAARRAFELLDRPVPDSHGGRTPAPDPSATGVALDAVAAGYDGARALEGVSLTIAPGEHVAITGASGAGKTTLLLVLLGFVRPVSGTVRAGPVDLADVDPDAWRARIGWIPQRPYLFAGTVADNVRLGRPDASDHDVRRALRDARLDVDPHRLVGEGGAGLSAGEVQRVGLARALLRGAPLVLLDEPTANLDASHAARFRALLRELGSPGARPTVVVATHDLGLALDADRVVVLDGGRIVADGPPRTLARSGPFHDLLRTRPPAPSAPRPEGRTPAPAAATAREGDGRDALADVVRPVRGRLALGALAGAATVACSVGLLGTSAWLIQRASLRPPILELTVAIVGVRFFGIARGVLRYAERLASHDAALRAVARLRARLFARLVPRLPGAVEARSGGLLHAVAADVEAVQDLLLRGLLPGLVAVPLALGVVIGVGVALPPAGALLAAGIAAVAVAVPPAAAALGERPARAVAAGRATVTAAVVELVHGLADVVAAGAVEARLAAVGDVDRRVAGEARRGAVRSAANGVAAALVGAATVWGVVALALDAAARGAVNAATPGVLALVTTAAFEAFTPLPQAATELRRGLAAARRLRALTDLPVPVTEPARPRAVTEHPALTLRLASVRHPDGTRALDGIDLDLTPGRRLAVVGASGAGKTTLVETLLRFRPLASGAYRVDGIDAGEVSGDDVRARISWVPQDAAVFDTTLAANVRIGRPDATDDQLAAAARRAGLLGWVESLPQGWETPAGERGVLLSGGQRRRLALARALLADRPILVLDEPTADLDVPTTQAVLAEVLDAAVGRSVLLVTHRLEGLDAVDEIVVLDAGRVVERGTHADLLAAGGAYAALWRAHHLLGADVAV